MGKNVTLNNSTLVILSETFRPFTRKLISQRYRFIMTGIFTFNQDVNNIYSSYFKRESSDYRDVTLVSQEGDFLAEDDNVNVVEIYTKYGIQSEWMLA